MLSLLLSLEPRSFLRMDDVSVSVFTFPVSFPGKKRVSLLPRPPSCNLQKGEKMGSYKPNTAIPYRVDDGNKAAQLDVIDYFFSSEPPDYYFHNEFFGFYVFIGKNHYLVMRESFLGDWDIHRETALVPVGVFETYKDVTDFMVATDSTF